MSTFHSCADLPERNSEPAGKQSDYKFKVITLGDGQVGKSSLILRYCDAVLPKTMFQTIGIDFRHKDVCVDGTKVQLQIWDTAGQERYDNITRAYVRNAVGMLLVYDITSQRSFERVRRWMNELLASNETRAARSVQILVGNKSDLDAKRQVSAEQGAEFAREAGFKFFETSAATGDQVDVLFEALATDVLSSKLAASTEEKSVEEKSLEETSSIEKPAWGALSRRSTGGFSRGSSVRGAGEVVHGKAHGQQCCG